MLFWLYGRQYLFISTGNIPYCLLYDNTGPWQQQQEIRNGGGMPGVEEEAGVTSDESEPADCQEDPLTKEEEQEEAEGGEEEEQERRNKQHTPRLSFRKYLEDKIMLACKLIFLFLALVLVVQSNGPMVRKTAPPQPFFPRHSLVSDFYSGDVGRLTERLLAADLSLVVYYAPWDRDSQLLRWELEKAARYHHEQIYFAAINCWHPGSECKSRFKIRTYPAVVLHVRASSGLETRALAYNGPLSAPNLIRFLSRALRPLAHVATHADLIRLQMESNAVVLGFYNFGLGYQLPKGFTSFYLGALRSLQQDHTSSVTWAVVTNPQVAAALSLNISQPIHLVLWNMTLGFTGAKNPDSEAISTWVSKRLDQTAAWLHISGSKSFIVDRLLQRGPLFMLFTPDNPYHLANDPFTLLREVSLDYHNYNESSRVSNLVRYLGSARTRGRSHLRRAEKVCRGYIQDQLQSLHFSRQQINFEDETCCRSLPSIDQAGASGPGRPNKVCDVCVHPTNRASGSHDEYCSTPGSGVESTGLLQHVNNLMTVFSDSCRELVLQYSPWEHYSVCCQSNTTQANSHNTTPPIAPPEDKREQGGSGLRDDHIERLVAWAAEDQCKRLFHGSLLAPSALLRDQQPGPDLTGLGSKTNKTLSFMAVDSIRHKDVAERLGVNLTAREPANTAAVIVDLQRESHFIMDASLSKQTVANFIINYTNGQLDRTLVSRGDKVLRVCEDSRLCLRELTSSNYLRVTQQPGEMVVVLHYSGNCAACSTIGHVLLTVANSAYHLPNITFARINTLHNTLPWHLTFHTLPTIIAYPHFRKDDSQVFDSSQALTPASLMAFVVSSLDPRHRLALVLAQCKEECRSRVSQRATFVTTRLHTRLTHLTLRLRHVLSRLVLALKEPPAHSSPTHSSPTHSSPTPHYGVLQLSKSQLTRDIRLVRLRLHHLYHVQSLLTLSSEERFPNSSDLLESLQYLLQEISYSSSGEREEESSTEVHDEL